MSVGSWLAVLLLASLSIVTTTAGVLLALRIGHRPGVTVAGIGFSTGVMVVVSVAELLPEAYEAGDAVWVTVAAVAGGLALAALHVVIPHTHLVHEHRGVPAAQVRTAYLVLFGLVLHDLPEGFALANSYASTPRLGVLVAIAIAAHNLPEQFSMAVPVVSIHSPRLLLRAAVSAALAEPVGALVGLAGVSLYPGLTAGFLAFAAGAMIFVSAHELYPMARELGRLRDFLTGLALAVVTVLALGVALRP